MIQFSCKRYWMRTQHVWRSKLSAELWLVQFRIYSPTSYHIKSNVAFYGVDAKETKLQKFFSHDSTLNAISCYYCPFRVRFLLHHSPNNIFRQFWSNLAVFYFRSSGIISFVNHTREEGCYLQPVYIHNEVMLLLRSWWRFCIVKCV